MKKSTIITYLLFVCCFWFDINGDEAFGQDISMIPEASPLTLNGNMGISLTKYSMEGAPARRVPTSWTVNGSFSASIYSLQLPFNFVFSEQERGFHQPFDQFGISPSYKWVTTHFGYRSMNLSRYTLAGVTFYGAGLEMNPGSVRIAAMYGRLQRESEEDTLNPYVIPAYKRMGYAVKLGFGSEESFFDLSYFHALDDTNSIRSRPASVLPMENSVYGLGSRILVVPEILNFDLEGAVSVLTRNVFSPKANLDSSDIPDFVSDLYNLRTSTSATLAGRAGLNFTVPHFGLRFAFEYIEPEFTSLGAYYFNTDMANLTLEPSFDIDDNALRVSGSIGYQYDNLNDLKESTTDRLIGSANISWNPSQVFGVDGQYSNYTTSQIAGLRVEAQPDTPRVRNVTQSLSLSPRVLIQGEEMSHAFTLAGAYQEYVDRSNPIVPEVNTMARNATFAYNLTFTHTPLSLGLSILAADARNPGIRTNTIGSTLNGSVTLIDNKLSLGLTAGYSHTSNEGISGETGVFNESMSAAYRLTKDDLFNLQINGTQTNNSLGTISRFNEITATLTYTRSFSFDLKDELSDPAPPDGSTPPAPDPGSGGK